MLQDFCFILYKLSEKLNLSLVSKSIDHFGVRVDVEQEIVIIEGPFEISGEAKFVFCVFSQGVNEMQALANLTQRGENLHQEINTKSLKILTDYLTTLHRKDLIEQLESLSADDLKKLQILHVTNEIILELDLPKIVFCKSGKDRTAMAITYEQTNLYVSSYSKKDYSLSEEKNLVKKVVEEPEDLLDFAIDENPQKNINQDSGFEDFLADLEPETNILEKPKGKPIASDSQIQQGKSEFDPIGLARSFREAGVRLEVARKNTGRGLYSFNKLQSKFIPAEFQPPASVIQEMMLSIQARDS
eukprot:augustus_masked-scaffold_69-processed-gene-0.58-mRNA-1 protein AED:0.28 eAED:0.28 QI:0/-1/0/1/-1/1/1/0/300